MSNTATFLMSGLLALAATVPAAAETRVTAGYDRSSGDYGQNVTTTIETAYLEWQSLSDRWALTLRLPWLRVTGNGTVVPGVTGPITLGAMAPGVFGMGGGGGSGTVTRSGLGDIVAGAGYAFPSASGFYEISAWVKLGTADENEALGTGENDYSLQVDAVPGERGLRPFVTLGYTWTGDAAGQVYEDVGYASAGLMFTGDTASLGISYDYRQAVVAGTPDLRQASAFAEWQGGAGWTVSLTALAGLSDASPDFGLGLAVAWQH